MTSDHPHVQAQAPTRSGGQQRGAVVCTLDEGDGGLGGCCERRAGLAQGSRAENSWLGTCPREAGFGARQMHRWAETPNPLHILDCLTSLHLQSANSDRKLLRLSRWRLQSVRPQVPGRLTPLECFLEAFPAHGFRKAKSQPCDFNGEAFDLEYNMWLFLLWSEFEANQNVNPHLLLVRSVSDMGVNICQNAEWIHFERMQLVTYRLFFNKIDGKEIICGAERLYRTRGQCWPNSLF